MSAPVVVLGIGAEGMASLSPRGRELLAAATFVAGGRRHLELIGPTDAESFVIGNNVDDLVARIRRRGEHERCVVLASGDPLFYGIGQALGQALGRDALVVVPTVSSMQLAFARAGLSWHDAAIASVHGRPLPDILLPLLGRPKIGLFTHDRTSPVAIARFFLERGLGAYQAFVGEDLGSPSERFTHAPLAALVDRTFADLNFLILTRDPEPVADAMNEDSATIASLGPIACVPDQFFAQPERPPVLLTHADVRATALARFWGLPDGPLWDVGAGIGGMAIGLARTFPEREVIAVERAPEQLAFLRNNRSRFQVHNLRIIAGTAPACLEAEARPAAVFLGGTGGNLDAIFDLLFDRLRERGVVVADFVTLENLARGLERLRAAGWAAELTQVQISQGRDLAGLTSLVPQRPVWVVRAVRAT